MHRDSMGRWARAPRPESSGSVEMAVAPSDTTAKEREEVAVVTIALHLAAPG